MNHHAYLNQILFPETRINVDAQYIAALSSLMFTKNWLQIQTNPIPKPEPEPEKLPKSVKPAPSLVITENKPSTLFTPKQRNTLFWAIYANEHPGEWDQTNPVSVEISTRMQIVESLKSQPKRLKDTNSKLTMEQSQALCGAMMVAQEDNISFCTAYSVYYNKHILLVYPQTYKIYSPTVTVDIEDDDHIIIVYVQRTTYGKSAKARVFYSVDLNSTKEKAIEIMNTKVNMDLNAQAKYTIAELELIADNFGLQSKTAEGKRRKKQELYDEIRVAIHRDTAQN